MTNNMHTHRIAPGLYQCIEKGNTINPRRVTVERRDDLNGWMAMAEWDAMYYSDPVSTYREAKEIAAHMLANPHI